MIQSCKKNHHSESHEVSKAHKVGTGVNFVVFDSVAVEIPLLCDVRLKVCSQRKSTIESGQLGFIALRLSDPHRAPLSGIVSTYGGKSHPISL